ncbi:MAG: GNAT family N-acetyltransferase [Cytophagales bacterium]
MIFNILADNNNSEFWNQYQLLWNNSPHKSPFNSPSFIKLLSEKYKDLNAKHFYLEDSEKHLLICLSLRNENNNWIFLGDGHSDYNSVLVRKELSLESQNIFLRDVLNHCGNSLFLKNVPPWTQDIKFWSQAKNISPHFINFQAWEYPVVQFENEADIALEMHGVFKKRRLNTYLNKLKKNPEFRFEIHKEADPALSKWHHDFCLNHESKWNDTDTPSVYSSKEVRDILKQKIISWSNEGICLRFTAYMGDEQMAAVICLINNDRIIYSLPSYSSKYEDSHISLVLLVYIGQWAAENGYKIFDFGVGAESYKLRFANKIYKVNRIYISNSIFQSNFIKSKFDYLIRNNQFVEKFWEKLILNFYRTRLKTFVHNAYDKMSSFFSYLKNPTALIKKLKSKILGHSVLFYVSEAKKSNHSNESKESSLYMPDFYEFIEFMNENTNLSFLERNIFIENYQNDNYELYGLKENGKLVQVSWLTISKDNQLPKEIISELNDEPIAIIKNCFTDLNFRRKGFYSKMLELLIETHRNYNKVIYTDDFNLASQKGILKAGFKYLRSIKN